LAMVQQEIATPRKLRLTKVAISGLQIAVLPTETPDSPLFSMGCYSKFP
jgi:hypothetical protein